MAAFVLDKIVAETDKHEVREIIKVSREEGKSIEQRIQELKKPSAGGVFMNGTCRLRQHIFKRVAKSKQERIEAEKKAAKEVREAHLKIVDAAQLILSLGLEDSKYMLPQLLSLIKALRRKDDIGALPTKKADRLKLYLEWKGRGFVIMEPAAIVPLQLPPLENEKGEVDDMLELEI